MLYAVGLLGFIAGFMIGQIVLAALLRNRSNDELRENKALHWKYGLLNWGIAMAFMAGAMKLYQLWSWS